MRPVHVLLLMSHLSFIDEQTALEADAREVLPYKFDKCTYDLGPLRQEIYACLTCSPPPASAAQVYTPAGICYSCSISCHGEHNLVELFQRRNFVCDCGTTRFPSTSPCTLRSDLATGTRGVVSQGAAKGNHYNHNFQDKFCACEQEYDAETEKGTMFQCIGLGTVESGGCGEDWFHPECLMGLPKDWNKREKQENDRTEEVDEHPAPPGFPKEDDFDAMICYKCVESNPWIKAYAGTTGFLAPVLRTSSSSVKAMQAPPSGVSSTTETRPSLKRKASDEDGDETARSASPVKRVKEESEATAEVAATPMTSDTTASSTKHKHELLPPAPKGTFSLFLSEDFREHLCHCPSCFPNLLPHQQLIDEEDAYEPSVSEASGASNDGHHSSARSQGTGSILERGEAALNNVDRVRAIEGVMVYNHLRDKVKQFLKPYAENGKAVSAEDIKSYFEKLRGDEEGIKEAGDKPVPADEDDGTGDNRREQSGY